jgi:hypothetical protein
VKRRVDLVLVPACDTARDMGSAFSVFFSSVCLRLRMAADQ